MKGLKTAGREELAVFRRRVLRLQAMGRLEGREARLIVLRLDWIERVIDRINEPDDTTTEVEFT